MVDVVRYKEGDRVTLSVGASDSALVPVTSITSAAQPAGGDTGEGGAAA